MFQVCTSEPGRRRAYSEDEDMRPMEAEAIAGSRFYDLRRNWGLMGDGSPTPSGRLIVGCSDRRYRGPAGARPLVRDRSS